MAVWCLLSGLALGALMPSGRRIVAWILLTFASAVPPLVVLALTLYGMTTYERTGPTDPGDAPAYVFMGTLLIAPFLLLVCFFLCLIGMLIGRRIVQNRQSGDHASPANDR